jgi:hypothetical protein
VPLPQSTTLYRFRRWNSSQERHPEPSCRTSHRVTFVANNRPPGHHNVPLNWEGDVQRDVTLQPGFSTRTVRDRVCRRRADVVPNGASGRRNLQGILPLASEGDVQGDIRRASSPSGSTFLWQTSAQSGTHRLSRPTRGEEG